MSNSKKKNFLPTYRTCFWRVGRPRGNVHIFKCGPIGSKLDVCCIFLHDYFFNDTLTGSSTNKTDRHDITEILLNVALNTIKQTKKCTLPPQDHCVIDLLKTTVKSTAFYVYVFI